MIAIKIYIWRHGDLSDHRQYCLLPNSASNRLSLFFVLGGGLLMQKLSDCLLSLKMLLKKGSLQRVESGAVGFTKEPGSHIPL